MKFYPTPWPQHLVYGYHQKRRCWCFFSTETKHPVGYPYTCQAELIADIKRYAREMWGLEVE